MSNVCDGKGNRGLVRLEMILPHFNATIYALYCTQYTYFLKCSLQADPAFLKKINTFSRRTHWW